MSEQEDVTLKVQSAIARFSDRKVYRKLMLASSPDAAKKIAHGLPGVKDLIDIGPDAGPAVLDLFNREVTNDNHLVTIALYLLWRIPTDGTTDSLAKYVAAQQLTGINAELAAEVFLNSTGIDAPHEDRFKTAVREAKKLVNKNPSQQQ